LCCESDKEEAVRSIRRIGVRVLTAGAVIAAVASMTASPASAGTCYTVTVENGSPNPPSITVCPQD
jgi:hypothetical protein